MRNQQLADELQQTLISLCTATTSLNVLSSLAQKIETRFKELEDKEVEVKKMEDGAAEKMKVLEVRENEVKENEERSKLKTKELEEK